MATVTKGKLFVTGEEVSADDLNNLVDLATVTNIVAADITNGTITNAKMSDMAASKLTGLGSMTAGQGILPSANGGTGATLATAAQGLLPYFASTGVMAALAVGTAGQVLSTNGSSANPSWINRLSIKVGTASRDISTSSGNQTFASVGFTPKLVIFFAAVTSTRLMSVGFDDGTTACVISDRSDVAGTYTINATTSISLDYGSGGYAEGKIGSFNSDGFVVAWTKTGSPTGTATINYIAIG